uniref:Zinc finger RING-H2-type domain-containing protein n=1 Tax=Ditylenchus dipsaci TaxID=166011 RepID=A0A915D9T3_9BILA
MECNCDLVWDVETDTCAICRVHLAEPCLRCQTDSKTEECVVVWESVHMPFIIAVWLYGSSKTIGVHFVNRTG